MAISLFVRVPEACGHRNLSELIALKSEIAEAIRDTRGYGLKSNLIDLRQEINEVLDSMADEEVENLLMEAEKAMCDGNIARAAWIRERLGPLGPVHFQRAVLRNLRFRQQLEELRKQLDSSPFNRPARRESVRTTRIVRRTRALAGGIGRVA